MQNLKHLRTRIASVKSTQKITSAMKMLSSVKLRKAQNLVIQARPYAHSMHHLLCNLIEHRIEESEASILLKGNEDVGVHLIILITGDRGLCGSFNTALIKKTRSMIKSIQESGKKVMMLTVGKKAYNSFKDLGADNFLATIMDIEKTGINYHKAREIAQTIVDALTNKTIGAATLVYSVFKSPIIQTVNIRSLVPFDTSLYWNESDPSDLSYDTKSSTKNIKANSGAQQSDLLHLYEFEPREDILLKELFPRNLAVQIYQSLLENQASEFGARMSAMDNATRNAQDVIQKFQLVYNRSRQAYITNELIEIIAGAQAL